MEFVDENIPKESNMYWIHCNKCLAIHKLQEKRILFLSCHHLSCEQCAKTANTATTKSNNNTHQYDCPICKKKVRALQIDNNLPHQIKLLFHPEPWQEGLPTIPILRFQTRHRQNFEDGMKRMRSIYKKERERRDTLRESCKQQFQLLQKTIEERKALEKRVLALKKRRNEDISSISSGSIISDVPLHPGVPSQQAAQPTMASANLPEIPEDTFDNFLNYDIPSFTL